MRLLPRHSPQFTVHRRCMRLLPQPQFTADIPPTVQGDVDLPGVARACEFYTGAELAAVCREAALAALREDIQAAACITARHFRAAQTMVKPALTAEKLAQFAAWGRGSK
mmetsp:Transcript_5899/g.15410  ORF Transcript_5899/g.15410 Transcript_5899/m.15410 type:complete len:110 (+) Transcript_5899:2226-2555(+)